MFGSVQDHLKRLPHGLPLSSRLRPSGDSNLPFTRRLSLQTIKHSIPFPQVAYTNFPTALTSFCLDLFAPVPTMVQLLREIAIISIQEDAIIILREVPSFVFLKYQASSSFV